MAGFVSSTGASGFRRSVSYFCRTVAGGPVGIHDDYFFDGVGVAGSANVDLETEDGALGVHDWCGVGSRGCWVGGELVVVVVVGWGRVYFYVFSMGLGRGSTCVCLNGINWSTERCDTLYLLGRLQLRP